MWCAKTFPTHVFHIRLDLRYPLEDPECRFVLSLGALACWSDEDFIGRVARAERRRTPDPQFGHCGNTEKGVD